MTVRKLIVLSAAFISFWCMPVLSYADQVHRVLPGETLSGIARQHGITTDSLLGNNQYISYPDMIYAGQVLIIPTENKQAYQVKPGDTLYRIAQDFEISMATLADVNQIVDRNRIYSGQILSIPKVYTVKAGDTLYGIARSLGMNMTDLSVENGLKNPDKLFVGQALIIPVQSSREETLADIEREMSPTVARFPDTLFYKGYSDGRRVVALTFDDGPDKKATSEVLDLLKMYRVPATFFLVGDNVARNGDMIKRIIAEGHTVASHTWSHPDLRTLTEAQLINEITQLENEIQRITGLRTALMRPPYGFVSDSNLQKLRELGYKVIKWSVDTNDWRDQDVDKVLINTMPDIRDGAIILMHDYLQKSVTKEALPEMIQSLRWQGYTFVTVDELLGVKAYQ